ncbi:MAG TPA: sulfite exporter TauE/SafE family protein [Candidatus Saccharimonadales bacterium]|nr:sulfite exporter TauE/SafE family protein [Candidatus Saccharimonadales bacterium]
MSSLLLILIGIAGGAVSGFVGLGGGIVIVPLLVLLLSYNEKLAQGTTLAMLSLPVAAFAAVTYLRAGYVNLKAALIMAIGFLVGSLVSAHFAVKLPTHTIARVFGGVLLVAAVKLLWFGR